MRIKSATWATAQPDPDIGHDAANDAAETRKPVVLGSSLVMNGDLELADEADLVIRGRVFGASISGVRNLYVGPDAHFSGDVESVTAEIAGTVEGRLTVRDTVLVRRTATLRGEVTAHSVRVEAGTVLDGSVLSGRISRG